MSVKSDLETSLAQVATRIREITASAQPTVSIDGESYAKTEYLAELSRQLKLLKQAIQDEDSPFILTTQHQV